jgi:hypothetical protein
MYAINKKFSLNIIIILVLLTLSAAHAAAVTVSIDAPEHESGNNFDVEIQIENVDDLDSGQYDIVFNSSVINITNLDGDIENGEIGDTEIPIENYYFMNKDTLRLLFNLPGVDGVSGSGTLAVIKFEVVGENGDSSYLNFSEGLLVDKESQQITADWVGTMVNIGETPAGSLDTYSVTLYVKNIDDDKLDIHLLIDGVDEDFESISSDKTNEYDSYKLEEAVHTFKIFWFDPDTNEWYEKIRELNITNVTTLVMTTDKHEEDEKDKISAHIYVKNPDNDDPDVYLYIDGNFKKYLSIPSDSTSDFGEYEFEEDDNTLHSFKLKWTDSGTGEEYEEITRKYITSEEAVSLSIVKHEKGETLFSENVSTTPAATPVSSTESPTSDNSGSKAGSGGISSGVDTQSPPEPEQPDKSTNNNDLIHSINNIYILVGFAAVLIALNQIRKV